MKRIKGPRAGYNPKTASNTEMKPKPPVLANNNNTSSTAERQIKQPPQPFANKKGPVNLPVRGQFESRGTDGVGKGKYSKGQTVGVKALPSGGAVGNSKLPNQSGQIGGRMGFPPPKRKAGSNASGYPPKRNAAFYGDA
jgi:hypothetical protein